MNYPIFTGQCWDHRDAQRRCPSAWKTVVVSGEFGDGTHWQREETERVCGPGLGHWERDGKTWIYVEPDGYARPVRENYDKPEPPPLPRPRSEWTKCGCGEAHTCSVCGKPYWVEIHGCADGVCTYCYHAG